VACLIECISNINKGKVPLTKTEKKKLKAHIKAIKKLSKERNTDSARKLLIKQKGGFLVSILAPILASIASGLIGNLIRS